ncbi:MAG TPA: hypothetical protein VF796_09155 [Humisphaera sp.]
MKLPTHDDHFPLLDLTALPVFKSASSVSFHLATPSELPFMKAADASIPSAFDVVGWVDVHHPCDGHIKARLRIALPAKYRVEDRKLEVVQLIFAILHIPFDETFEATFLTTDQQSVLERFRDRRGNVDRLY